MPQPLHHIHDSIVGEKTSYESRRATRIHLTDSVDDGVSKSENDDSTTTFPGPSQMERLPTEILCVDDPSTLFCVSHRLHGLGEPLRVSENVVPLTNRGWIIRDHGTSSHNDDTAALRCRERPRSLLTLLSLQRRSGSTVHPLLMPLIERLSSRVSSINDTSSSSLLSSGMRNRRRVDGRLSVFRQH